MDDTIGDYYYFNTNSGETQWAHPLDEIYRQKVIVARESGKNASTSVVTEDSTAETMDKPKLVRIRKISRQIDVVLYYLANECFNLTNFSSENVM